MRLDILLLFLSVMAAVPTLYILAPSVIKILLRRQFLLNLRNAECACLTFDDGPDPSVTTQLLDLLDETDTKATFFLVGNKAEACPEIVRRMLESGHEVGEHSYAHHFPWKSGPVRSVRDLWRCGKVLDAFQAGNRQRLFRPPFGKFNLVGLIYVYVMARRVVFWSNDPQDYGKDLGKDVASSVTRDLVPGTVVLLHDGSSRTEKDTKIPVVVSAVREILEEARSRGLRLSTVGDMLFADSNGPQHDIDGPREEMGLNRRGEPICRK